MNDRNISSSGEAEMNEPQLNRKKNIELASVRSEFSCNVQQEPHVMQPSYKIIIAGKYLF